MDILTADTSHEEKHTDKTEIAKVSLPFFLQSGKLAHATDIEFPRNENMLADGNKPIVIDTHY